MKILILDDDRIFGNILSHQISELTNGQWICHFIQDNKHISDLLPKVDMILVDKHLDDCAYDSATTIRKVKSEFPNVKIIMISSSENQSDSLSVPFIFKDERIAVNVTSLEN